MVHSSLFSSLFFQNSQAPQFKDNQIEELRAIVNKNQQELRDLIHEMSNRLDKLENQAGISP